MIHYFKLLFIFNELPKPDIKFILLNLYYIILYFKSTFKRQELVQYFYRHQDNRLTIRIFNSNFKTVVSTLV